MTIEFIIGKLILILGGIALATWIAWLFVNIIYECCKMTSERFLGAIRAEKTILEFKRYRTEFYEWLENKDGESNEAN